MNNSNALVMSGGAIKGAFQVGAIRAVIEAGFLPGIIYGISVGALNGAFLANGAAKKAKGDRDYQLTLAEWLVLVDELEHYWRSRIKGPNDVAIKRNVLVDAWNIIFKKFNGLTDTRPMMDKIDDEIDVELLKSSPVRFYAGTVDFISGKMIQCKPEEYKFMDFLKGSMGIPIMMPSRHSTYIGDPVVLFDGGVRDVAPLGFALNMGAEKIVGLICQTEKVDHKSEIFSDKKLVQLIERAEGIMIRQNIQNDAGWIDFINEILKEAKEKQIDLKSWKTLGDYRLVDYRIIRPAEELPIQDDKFNEQNIDALIRIGYERGKQMMKKKF